MTENSNPTRGLERNGLLVLEDGTSYEGWLVGARDQVALGEIVFNTSLTGYQEVLTDPSYAGQIVTMTAPEIGNYGVREADDQAARPWVTGFVVREASPTFSNPRGEGNLGDYLEGHGVLCIEGVDTRRITRHIRSEGAMRAGIAGVGLGKEELLERVLAHPKMAGLDLTSRVSTPQAYRVSAAGGRPRFRVAVYDFGVKQRSLDLLAERGCALTVYPSRTSAEEVLSEKPDGVFLSNGPGDPEPVPGVRELIGTLAAAEIPVFGICLGHQLVARGFGADTFKLLYGHRGGNHPVRDLATGRVEITSQNHGFAVQADGESIPGAPDLIATHVNLNDGTLEGVRHRELPILAVQYHPEAAPGPHDSRYLFERFVEAMDSRRGRA